MGNKYSRLHTLASTPLPNIHPFALTTTLDRSVPPIPGRAPSPSPPIGYLVEIVHFPDIPRICMRPVLGFVSLLYLGTVRAAVCKIPSSDLGARHIHTATSHLPPPVAAPRDYVASTWYAGWHSDDFPPEKVAWDKYTSVTYAFA